MRFAVVLLNHERRACFPLLLFVFAVTAVPSVIRKQLPMLSPKSLWVVWRTSTSVIFWSSCMHFDSYKICTKELMCIWPQDWCWSFWSSPCIMVETCPNIFTARLWHQAFGFPGAAFSNSFIRTWFFWSWRFYFSLLHFSMRIPGAFLEGRMLC